MKTGRHYLAYRSFWPELETMRKFYESGYRTFCFMSSNTCNLLGEPYTKYPPVWVWDKTYVFENLDRQIEDILFVAPEAELLCMIDLNTPFWYVRYYGNNGWVYDSFDQLGRVASCPRWREDTKHYLEAFLKHTEAKYAKHIKGYILAGGSTCEWIDRSRGDESTFRFEAYRKYCQKQNLPEPAGIPSRFVRDHVSGDHLRDPVKDAEALCYWKFTNVEIRETLEFYLKTAHAAIRHRDDVELGTFFGYILQLAGQDGVGGDGHWDYEALFALDELDFIISPGIYHDRDLGGGCGAMTPLLTLEKNGKKYLYECDQRTHTFNPNLSKYAKLPFLHFPDEESTIAGLKREFAFALIHHTSIWFFDMWGGYYQGENIYALLRRFPEFWKKYSERDENETAQILLVTDPESMLYADYSQDSSYDYCVHIQTKLNHTGAPYRVCSFGDLECLGNTGKLEKFKLVVMANLFVTDDKRIEVLEKYLFRGCRTILWQYLPGIIHNGCRSEDHVEFLTGIPYHSSGINSCEKNGWKSILARDPAELTAERIRSAGESAGVHFYAPVPVVVYADGDFLALHTGSEREMEIRLPENISAAQEMFSGLKFREKNFSIKSSGPATYLFQLTPNMTTGEKS